ncbi:MAG: OmpA family protein [Bryobacteraceae bacterium]|nr:OmpA family protein [Bryobacteraceae bacterium]MCX7605549.1 OmpA family protein [Bryobacteraceae bacterium]
MPRAPRQEHPNHERWLVSYADFITLLFAFFVMLYSHSQMDREQAARISQAFREAMEEGRLTHVLSRLLKNAPPPKPRAQTPAQLPPLPPPDPDGAIELLPSLRELKEKLHAEIDSGRVEIRMERRGLVISLKEATFFPPGGDAIQPQALPVIESIALELRKVPNPIRLEGHTDSTPIHNSRFRSNWELSAARGIAMLELFATRFGIPRERMAIAGYADTAPVAPNDTEAGRARNRRVDIVVLNETGTRQEPRPQGGSGD